MNHDFTTPEPQSRVLEARQFDPNGQHIEVSLLHTVAINEGDTIQWSIPNGAVYTVRVNESEWWIWDDEDIMLINCICSLVSFY